MLRSLAFLLALSGPIFGQVTADTLNQAFNFPLFPNGTALWEEDAEVVAKRIAWPRESQTAESSSYRYYPPADERILGVRPFSLALYGDKGKVSALSLVFANKGDVAALIENDDSASRSRQLLDAAKLQRDYKKFIRRDAATLEAKLTELLGPPKLDTFGNSRDTREKVKRWNWQGHSFLLAAPRDEYVALRLMPQAVADGSAIQRTPAAEMREKLAKHIERRPNGDVVLRDLPMVDQGPKGYCVPATWERVLRYLGIPADMYVLAMSGNTAFGGGTSVEEISAGVTNLVQRYGRRLANESGRIDLRKVARHIDRGLPLMWSMYSLDELNRELTTRSQQRQGMADAKAWSKQLDPARKAARQLQGRREGAHMCMIIGYNPETEELAISDSWGPEYAERWITLEEANAISQGKWVIIEL